MLARLYVGRGDWRPGRWPSSAGSPRSGRGSEAQFNGPLRQAGVELHMWRNEYDAARRAMDETLDVLAGTEDVPILAQTIVLSAMVEGDTAERARAAVTSAEAAAEARLSRIATCSRDVDGSAPPGRRTIRRARPPGDDRGRARPSRRPRRSVGVASGRRPPRRATGRLLSRTLATGSPRRSSDRE